MFSLTQIGPTSSDCTARYLVTLYGDYTLQEFINEVLSNKGEWGTISIAKRGCLWYNYPSFSYRYGEIRSRPTLPEEVYSYKIKDVRANGGWSNMDYTIQLEKEI